MYIDKLLICKAKLDEEGNNCVLDLPFPVYHQSVVHKGRCYGPYPLPKTLDGQEVLAVVTISNHEQIINGKIAVANDVEKASKFPGLVADYKTDAKVATHWAVKKADAKATVDDLGNVTKYAGADKDDRSAFCVSTCTMTTAEVKACGVSACSVKPK